MTIPMELDHALRKYARLMSEKEISSDNTLEDDFDDPLMEALCLTQTIKSFNRQYYNKTLGGCLEEILKNIHKAHDANYDANHVLTCGYEDILKRPADIVTFPYGIELKYRAGSGDPGFRDRFKRNAALIRDAGLEPIFLIYRTDNRLEVVREAKKHFGVFVGEKAVSFLKALTDIDLNEYLIARKGLYKVWNQSIELEVQLANEMEQRRQELLAERDSMLLKLRPENHVQILPLPRRKGA